jgi:hypothetical protein
VPKSTTTTTLTLSTGSGSYGTLGARLRGGRGLGPCGVGGHLLGGVGAVERFGGTGWVGGGDTVEAVVGGAVIGEPATAAAAAAAPVVAGYELVHRWCSTHQRHSDLYGGPTVGRFSPKIHPPTCTVNGCDRPYYAKGKCRPHHERAQHWTASAPPPGRSAEVVSGCDNDELST